MKVPLCISEGDTFLRVVRDGEFVDVPFTHKPYVLHLDPAGTEEYTNMWTKVPMKVKRYEFDSMKAAKDFYLKLNRRDCVFMGPKERIFLEHPEWLEQFRQEKELKVLFIDLEVLTDGSGVFPKASKDPILCMSVILRGSSLKQCISCFDPDPAIHDRKILEEFKRIYTLVDPDIICGYNIGSFDIPYLLQRLGKQKISPAFLTRDGTMPFVKEDRLGKDIVTINFEGRVIWDLYRDVQKDQSLLGKLKDKKLKSVGKFYGLNMLELDVSNTKALIGDPRLAEYNLSDSEGCNGLFSIYGPRQIILAEDMQLPLNDIINGFSSTIPRVMCGREILKQRLLPLETNADRYDMGTEEEPKKFEAATVEIMKPGFHQTVWKYDAASLYPSIMRTFNLGPDTVTFLKWLPYTSPELVIESDGQTCFMQIPDKNFQKTAFIKIDFTKDSFIRQKMTFFFERRLVIKAEIKKHPEKSDKWNALQSESWSIKVGPMNSVFGYQGSRWARWGDMVIGMAICAIGRLVLRTAVEPYKDKIIELDTDGVYFTDRVNVEDIDRRVQLMVYNAIKGPCHIRFEEEGPWTGYFHLAKNYALRAKDRERTEDNGKITYHGVSMKGSKACRIYDTAIRQLTEAILSNTPQDVIKDLVLRLRDFSNYGLGDFVQRVTVKQTSYKTKTDFKLALMEEAARVTGKKMGRGESIEYLKCIDGYHLASQVTSMDQLDQVYYMNLIEKAQEMFGLQDIHKTPEQIHQEALDNAIKASKKVLTEEKSRLRLYMEGKAFDGFDMYKDISIDEAKAKIKWIEKIQEAFRCKWPCPSCQHTDYTIQYPQGLKCDKCNWTGLPVKPLKPRSPRKKKEIVNVI